MKAIVRAVCLGLEPAAMYIGVTAAIPTWGMSLAIPAVAKGVNLALEMIDTCEARASYQDI